MQKFLLFSLLALGVSAKSFLKRPKFGNKGMTNVTALKAKKVLATEKYQLIKKDGEWKSSCAIRGLALGGWFVPEKFINIPGWHTPDMPNAVNAANAEGTIYEGADTAPDLCSLSRKIGREELDTRMKRHMADFIKEDDFKYIAKTGVNTLRIPVGYWNVIEDPYEMYAPIEPETSMGYLDKAMEWAKKYDLAVIIDLHASPGSQNGWEHSGCSGSAGLFHGGKAEKNQKLSVEVVGKLAQRYAQHPALLGIEVINEPVGYKGDQLVQLYKDSYDAIREHDNNVWVIAYAHNAERVAGLKQYDLHNFVLDKHNYACFGDGRNGPPGHTVEHHTAVVETWKKDLSKMSSTYPTIMGEWSLCHGGGSGIKLDEWNHIQQKAWKHSTVGAVFWTYKTMTDNARWSYRVSQDSVDVMGELPRCMNEDAAPAKLLAKFRRQSTSAKEVDVGYEWEAQLESTSV